VQTQTGFPNFAQAPAVGFVPDPVPASVGAAPAIVPTRKRTRRNKDAAVWGAAAVSLIIMAVAIYFDFHPGNSAKTVTGRLTAVRMANTKFEPAIVHRDWLVGIDEETLGAVLKQMEKRTITLRSDTLTLKFTGAPEGIKVTATPGNYAELISIDPAQHKLLANWSQGQGAKVSDRHQLSLVGAGEEFIKEWANAEASGNKAFDFNRFHGRLGIAALNKGLGSELVAIVGETAYDCVAEQQGLLFFLLPPGTERFELQGRDHGGSQRVFDAQFVVDVVTRATVPAESKGGSPDPDSDSEKSERNTKSFGTPALNDPSAADAAMPKKKMNDDE
jgi:hypothetical protein